jgi:hypothetical protein
MGKRETEVGIYKDQHTLSIYSNAWVYTLIRCEAPDARAHVAVGCRAL